MNALADLRERARVALVPVNADWPVIPAPVDALAVPAFMLVWADPWAEPMTTCFHRVRLDVVAVSARVDAEPSIALLEEMIEGAVPALRGAGLPEASVSTPGRFEIGNVAYLAARVALAVPLTIGGTTP